VAKKTADVGAAVAVLEPTELVDKELGGASDQLDNRIADPEKDVDFYPGEADKEETEEEETSTEGESPFGVWDAETAQDKGFKALLYGPSGAGKTWYAATFPRPLFLDLEGGLRTTVQVKPVLRYPKNPKQEVTKFEQVREFYRLVRKDKNPQYETIVIDTLFELQYLITRDIVKNYDANRQMDDQLTLQDYGKLNRVLMETLRSFLKLPYHIVFTCGQTEPAYEGALVYPKLIGQASWPELRGLVEQIGYVHVRKGGGESGVENVVSYRSHPSFVAKTRLPIEETFLPNDFKYLLKYAEKIDD